MLHKSISAPAYTSTLGSIVNSISSKASAHVPCPKAVRRNVTVPVLISVGPGVNIGLMLVVVSENSPSEPGADHS